MLPCHSGRHHKQEKKSRGNTSSCVGGQVKTRSLSLICQQKQAEDRQVKILLQVFWLDAFRRQESGMGGNAEWQGKVYISSEQHLFFFFSFLSETYAVLWAFARRPVSSRADWQGCGVECRALSGLSCVIIASHAVSLTDVLRRGRPVTQKQWEWRQYCRRQHLSHESGSAHMNRSLVIRGRGRLRRAPVAGFFSE